jgi:predicted RNA-binding Zn ribbon-like protein
MVVTEPKSAPGDLRLIQEFVNTRDVEENRDDLGSPDLLAAWLESHGLPAGEASPTEADRRHAIEVREALRALLFANNGVAADPRSVATLNRAAEGAPLIVRMLSDGDADTAGGSLPLQRNSSSTQPAAALEVSVSGVQGAMGRLLSIVFTAMVDGTWPRLKACRDHGCQWAFYDHSKNRSGTWCSMAVCGNRTKTRVYRQRSRASAARPPRSPTPKL